MANVEYSGNPEATGYYDRLGASVSTDQQTLTTIGKIAKREVHPDNSGTKTKTAEVQFNRVNTAVNVLRDPEKRDAYDTFIDRFGTETGTKEYENWVESGRPTPANKWASSSGTTATTTSSQRQPNTRRTTATTTSSQSKPNTERTDTEGSENETTTTGSTNSTTDQSYGYRTTTETESASQQAETQSTDSDTTAADATGTNNSSFLSDTVRAVAAPVMATPLGMIFTTTAPKSVSTRLFLVLATHWVLSFAPISSALIFSLWIGVFIPFPRISLWLSLASCVYFIIYYISFTTPFSLNLLLGVGSATSLAVGYYLLVRGSSLDPYTARL